MQSKVSRSVLAIAGVTALGAVALTGCSSSASSSSSSSASPSASGAVTIQLTALNNSGVNGSATLTPQGDQTLVTINVTGEPDGAYEPAHIHQGTCAKINPNPQYFLTDSSSSSGGGRLWVENGQATALVNATLESIQATPHAINLHLSPQNLPHYMACGDIPTK